MSMWIPVVQRTLVELKQMAQATSSVTAQDQSTIMVADREPFYDTVTAVTGAAQILTFNFQNNSDKAISNSQGGNGAPFGTNNFFVPNFMGVDFLSTITTAAAPAGLLQDISQILTVGQAYAQVTLGQVAKPEVPLTFLHSSGGAMGGATGTLAASNTVQWGQNGPPDSGYCMGNSYIFSNFQNLKVQIFIKAVTLNASVPLRVWFDGDWHKPIS